MAPSLKIFKILRFFKGFGRFWPRIGKKIQQKTQFPRHLFNSVSDCRFRDFRPFSAIAENHWPYTVFENHGCLLWWLLTPDSQHLTVLKPHREREREQQCTQVFSQFTDFALNYWGNFCQLLSQLLLWIEALKWLVPFLFQTSILKERRVHQTLQAALYRACH